MDNSGASTKSGRFEGCGALDIVICYVDKKVDKLWKSMKMVWISPKVIHIGGRKNAHFSPRLAQKFMNVEKLGSTVDKFSTYPQKNVDNSRNLKKLKKCVKNACNLILHVL